MILTIGHAQGHRRFSGAQRCQGLAIWPRGEVSLIRLDPEGCLVRRFVAIETLTVEDTDAYETARQGWDAMQHTSAKKCKREAVALSDPDL